MPEADNLKMPENKPETENEAETEAPKVEIEFSFFATVDRIDCTSKKVHLSPAYTYEENIWDENPKKFIHLLDFDAMQATGVKIKGLQLSGKIPYDRLVIGEKSSDGEEGDGMVVLHLESLAVCVAPSPSKLKFHVSGTVKGEKLVVKEILSVSRA